MQGSLPAGWLTFTGRELNPLDRDERFSELHVRSPFLSFPVARVVYAKPPFGGPEQVLAYLGRYTHRVAIANSRLLALDEALVRFAWKDYRHGGHTKVMALEAGEFIRRFLLHTLPDGFHRIRHYGFLANGARTERLARCRQLLDVPATSVGAEGPDEHDRDRKLTWRDFALCPDCGGAMRRIASVPRSSPPPFRCDTS